MPANRAISSSYFPQSRSRSYSRTPANTPRFTSSTSNHGRPNTSRSSTTIRNKGKSVASAQMTNRDQQIICATSESRGISPVVGLAFVNLTTTEVVFSQISDTQLFVRTMHKLWVFQPSEILFMTTAVQSQSKLYALVEANLSAHLPYSRIVPIDRKYWSEITGIEYIQNLAFKQDVEAIKVSVEGNFYATCCVAAALKYIELQFSYSFSFHSLRMKYEPPEDSMMIDQSTVKSLELIQNLQNAKSKDCLFGILNQTLTPMGARLLKSNILQPLTNIQSIEERRDAVDELTTKEDVFFAIRQALKAFVDVDRVLTAITMIPNKPSIQYSEQSINNVLLLKQYIKSIRPVHEALGTARSKLLAEIFRLCSPEMVSDVESLIDSTINADTAYSSQPLELRNQRTYAVAAGVNGLLDVARQTYKEACIDAYQMVTDLSQAHKLQLDLKYETARSYYIRIYASELEGRELPDVFINVFRRKNVVECQTLDLLKWNQKITDSHHEVLQMSDQSIQALTDEIRKDMAPLFKICDAIALLDMLASFAQVVTTQDYVKPEMTQTLAIKDGRHPILEKIAEEKFIPNDAYATQQSRFQIITGCNMSGKSTYIRSLVLMAVLAQIGSFVPASYASFPIFGQLFARVSVDDSAEASVSTFSAEMREMAFILRNVDDRSMVIIDELGRGTSTVDGLCIAIAIAEALIDTKALVFFATHFRDLATILAERSGVVNLHLAVDMREPSKMSMLYKIAQGSVQEKNYGIALAKVMGFPANVLEIAEEVSNTLSLKQERQKQASKTVAIAKRRKLVLSLKEQLAQAEESSMEGEALKAWLKKLQDEFVIRMTAVNEEIEAFDRAEISDEMEIETFDAPRTPTRVLTSQESTVDSRSRSESRQDSTVTDIEKGQNTYRMAGALQPMVATIDHDLE